MHCKMKAKKKYGKGGKLYNNGGEVTPLKKKKAGMTHSDGARRVPNYKKGASDVKKEIKSASDREQHRLGKAGKPKLAQQLKNGGKIPSKLKKKGPATSKIKNNQGNLEARKVSASSMAPKPNVGKNPKVKAYMRDLKPSGYKPQPKDAPKAMPKIKGYKREYNSSRGKYENTMIDRSTNSDAKRAMQYAAKKKRK